MRQLKQPKIISVLSLVCLSLLLIFFSTGYSSCERSEYHLALNPLQSQPSVWTDWFYLEKGTMTLEIHNFGPSPVYYFVFAHCDHLECPTIADGMVPPGKTEKQLIPHESGKFLFKMDQSSVGRLQQSIATGRIYQGKSNR
ncbi:hypothetical protein [Thermoactinomyces mirandus]|uniref:Uncharacterized protein n=1 Tax=Thermoactinomyces mirandus TaxID=2756294 RepID=A0A7W1XT08_9BACL|nr:hypothetical protein [Thermoactinomyces mirandus]MBA4602729.1 hypothetical protein [Thermoactinomyces mirandus]